MDVLEIHSSENRNTISTHLSLFDFTFNDFWGFFNINQGPGSRLVYSKYIDYKNKKIKDIVGRLFWDTLYVNYTNEIN